MNNNENEHELFVNFYSEAFNLFGNDCYFIPIEGKIRDINHDPHILYGEKIPMRIVFESNPKTILKRLGWYNEDDELPYVAYIAFKDGGYTDIEIHDDCLIEVLSSTSNKKSNNRTFIITNIRGNKIDPLYWTIKLAPYRPDEVISPSIDKDTDDNVHSGYHYVKR